MPDPQDLREKLNQLHSDVVEVLCTRLQGETVENDDIRLAMQLLKQNQVSTAAMPDTPASELARIAGKLSFSALEAKTKVVPLLPPEFSA
ncbi:MAG: hypothetical protein VKM34_08185 [Cyanobacteriota bacterium]|nr:hypothetical protein [Cyanobacteriota bacterium]